MLHKIIQDQKKEILGLLTVVELKKLKGRSSLEFPVDSVISIWEDFDNILLLQETI